MPDSSFIQRFGFSTGALEKGDYKTAVNWARKHQLKSIELSALRYEELEPLMANLDRITMTGFSYVSFHAPSFFRKEKEKDVISMLRNVMHRGWKIVVHPDVIYRPSLWRIFGGQLLIENMDRRKQVGRTVDELSRLFEKLPEAKLCLDVAHARQFDTTLRLLNGMVHQFRTRIAEVHISELDSHYRHLALSESAVRDYQSIAAFLPKIPIIIESMLAGSSTHLRIQEISFAQTAMRPPGSHLSPAHGDKTSVKRRHVKDGHAHLDSKNR